MVLLHSTHLFSVISQTTDLIHGSCLSCHFGDVCVQWVGVLHASFRQSRQLLNIIRFQPWISSNVFSSGFQQDSLYLNLLMSLVRYRMLLYLPFKCCAHVRETLDIWFHSLWVWPTKITPGFLWWPPLPFSVKPALQIEGFDRIGGCTCNKIHAMLRVYKWRCVVYCTSGINQWMLGGYLILLLTAGSSFLMFQNQRTMDSCLFGFKKHN